MQFLHVQDLAEIIVHFADVNFGKRAIYNVAVSETMNAEAWVKSTAVVLGVSKFENEVNWMFRFNFDDGIENTLSSYEFDELRLCSPSSAEEIFILAKAGGTQRSNGH